MDKIDEDEKMRLLEESPEQHSVVDSSLQLSADGNVVSLHFDKYDNLDLPANFMERMTAVKPLLEFKASLELAKAAMDESQIRRAGLRFHNFLKDLTKLESVVAPREAAVVHQLSERARELTATYGGLSHRERLSALDEFGANMAKLTKGLAVEEHFKLVNNMLYGGMKHYGIDVSFEDLAFKVGESDPYLPQWLQGPETVGNATGRMMFGWFFRMKAAIQRCGSSSKVKPQRVLLDNLTGTLKAGRMTLILGEAGSGKTSMMNALANRIKNEGNSQSISGSVYYNDMPFTDFHVPTLAQVVSQLDKHIATLTVRETLQFASDARRLPLEVHRKEVLKSDSKMDEREKELMDDLVNAVLRLLGLSQAADTVLGDSVLKGVSGGEKRRVTLGEMYVAGARVWFLDEISTGLDSAATFDITKMLLQGCRVFNFNILISLLQPPPESYDLFDDLILMADGMVVYHGPKLDVLPYFESIGFTKPAHMDTADYLQEVIAITSTSQAFIKDSLKAPKTSAEFAEKYRASNFFEVQKQMVAESRKPLDDDAPEMFKSSRAYYDSAPMYRHSFSELTKLVFKRQATILLRNRPFLMAVMMQNLIMGLLIGMLCFQLPFEQYYIKAALLFQMLMFVGFASTPLIPNIFEAREVFYKQSRGDFYSGSSYMLADFLTFLPVHFFQSLVLGSIIYFMVGFSLDSAGPYFVFMFLVISYGIFTGCLVRYLSYTLSSSNQAMGFYVMFVMMTVTFSGAIITRLVIPGWYIWIYWASPLTWVYNGLMQNEFFSKTYMGEPQTVNNTCIWYCGTDSCPPPYPQMPCGNYFLEARQIPTDESFLWIAFGFIWAAILIVTMLSTYSLVYIRNDDNKSAAAAAMRSSKHFHQVKGIVKPDTMKEGESVAGSTELQDQLERGSSTTGLEFNPVTLSFRNLVYSVDVMVDDSENHHKKTSTTIEILKGVDGYAKPYEMTALMGSSGAGKTTLLDVLAGRKTTGTISGEIFCNGKPKVDSEFARTIGYVEQFGVHMQRATVQESIEFSAALRLVDTSGNSVGIAVEHALEMLELNSIANHLVGTDDQGLSFEEVKRLTIAVELVANPSIIFADEPTSGLESRAAMVVMRCLQNVAASGRTVVCTIHQPSLAIFQLFDNLLLMRRGGEVVFFSSLGDRCGNLLEYFESYSGVTPCPAHLNPATWMLSVIGAGVGSVKQQLDFAAEYRNSEMYEQTLTELDKLMPLDWLMSNDQPLSKKSKDQLFLRDRSTQIRLLSIRNFIEYWRTPSYGFYRMMIVGGLALLIGCAFVDKRGIITSSADVQSLVSSINLLVNVLANYNVATVIPFLFTRKALFYRESASKMYAPSAFAIANNFVEDPYVIAEVVISILLYYFLVGYVTNPIWVFFYFIFLTLIFTMAMTFIGMFYAALMPSAASAQVLGTLTAQLLGLFSGIIVLPNTIPGYLIWIYYLSPQRWLQEGLIMTQFNFITNPICYPTGSAVVISAGDTCESGFEKFNLTDPVQFCCCPSGSLGISAKDYVQGPLFLGGPNGYSFSFRWWDILYILVIMVLARAGGVIVQAHVNHNKR